MTCEPLPATGLGADLVPLLVLALALVVAGAVAVLLARRHGEGGSGPLLAALLLGGAVSLVGLGAPAPAHAETDACLPPSPAAQHLLEVTQTSTMAGLAPGVPPVPITGRLANHSRESTHVTAVLVEIRAVTTLPGVASAACTPGDYRLISPWMPVGRTLEPGGSASFAGAAIGFADRDHDQDACQGATVHLRYTANPD